MDRVDHEAVRAASSDVDFAGVAVPVADAVVAFADGGGRFPKRPPSLADLGHVGSFPPWYRFRFRRISIQRRMSPGDSFEASA